MNERQAKLIEMIEKHLAQEVSLEQMRGWLVENIRPITFSSETLMQPGTWLESHADRTIRGHILYLEDPTILRGSDLDWYWEDVKQILDLLFGNKLYKRTVHWLEFPLDDEIRKDDKWMLSYLEYVENIYQLLVETQTQRRVELNLPKLGSPFKAKPLYLQTGAEMIMGQMLDIIEDYKDLISSSTRLPEHFYSIDFKTVQLNQLGKLIKCFKGELPYSISATFEGFDKFAITVFVI